MVRYVATRDGHSTNVRLFVFYFIIWSVEIYLDKLDFTSINS